MYTSDTNTIISPILAWICVCLRIQHMCTRYECTIIIIFNNILFIIIISLLFFFECASKYAVCETPFSHHWQAWLRRDRPVAFGGRAIVAVSVACAIALLLLSSALWCVVCLSVYCCANTQLADDSCGPFSVGAVLSIIIFAKFSQSNAGASVTKWCVVCRYVTDVTYILGPMVPHVRSHICTYPHHSIMGHGLSTFRWFGNFGKSANRTYIRPLGHSATRPLGCSNWPVRDYIIALWFILLSRFNN